MAQGTVARRSGIGKTGAAAPSSRLEVGAFSPAQLTLARRRRDGMTEKDLARAAGISFGRFCAIDGGCDQPTARELASLCRALRCRAEDLFTWRQADRAAVRS